MCVCLSVCLCACVCLATAATAAAHRTCIRHSTRTTDSSACSPTAATRPLLRLIMPQTSDSYAADVKKLTFAVGVLVWGSLDRSGQLGVLH